MNHSLVPIFMNPPRSTIKETLRTLAAENPEEAAKRRLRARAESAAVAKVMKKASILADFITEQDREKSMQVVREAKNAMMHVYDQATKCLVERPDHKTRLAAVALERGYDEGLPVERVLQGQVEMESMDVTLARLRGSPEAMKVIAGMKAAGVKLTIEGEVIDVDATVEGTEEPGS